MPADYLLTGHVLKSAQVGPVAVGQRQVGDVTDPDPIGLSGLGLVEQPVRRAAQPVGRIGGARREGLGLQRAQAPAAYGRPQALTAHQVPLFPQRYLEAAGAITAFMHPKHLDQRRFPSGLALRCPLLRSLLPRVVTAGRYA